MKAGHLAEFRWNIGAHFNIGTAVCDYWAEHDPSRLAIIEIDEEWNAVHYDYASLARLSARLSNALTCLGFIGHRQDELGDRLAVLLPQSVETAATHIAVTRMGGISIPLFTLFGPEALRHRLRDSGTSAIVTNSNCLASLAEIAADLPDLKLILCKNLQEDAAARFPGIKVLDFDAAVADQPDSFHAVETKADDPALIIYTSGTTGSPKGALHAHRVLLGHLPGVEVSHNLLPQPGDRLWTPADWAWIGGLLDVLMPGLYHGVTVVACRFKKFTPEAAFRLMDDFQIRNTFLPPTALKMMRASAASKTVALQLRSVASGGEPLGAELLEWGQKVFGTTINEFYGQTECNMTISSCSAIEPPLPGAIGRAAPGHRVAIIDPLTGLEQPTGAEGEIAVAAPDPVMFLGYLNNPEATAAKYVLGPDTKWLLTGDRGMRPPDGRFVFVGRDDDVISSAGYRIGPAEIENCLLQHSAVALAGVVGQPDPVRGHIVAAFITLKQPYTASSELASEISEHVKRRLAAYEYPRAVHFIDEMPMTTTGKIIRAELRLRAASLAEQTND